MGNGIVDVLIVLAVTVGSVILHELMHGVIAYALGDRTAKEAGRLTLNPFKHIDPIMSILVPVLLYIFGMPVFGGAKPVPVDNRNLKGKEWGMALVAVSGPLTNFLIALIAALIGYFSGTIMFSGGGIYYNASSVLSFAVVEIIYINLGFMLFNLIPIPPLDGSRVLYALAPDFFRDILARIEKYGVIVIYALILVFGNVFSGLMVFGTSKMIEFFCFLVGA